jgi:UDP-N-acetyl-2-amino-2-deoxyglucuronate dehydrogenase
VISEKPLVIEPSQLDELSILEEISGKKIWSILQLRLHKELLHLKKTVQQNSDIEYNVDLRYVTPRGPWYFSGTWKSIDELSGSILYNLGIHLFDACHFVFGDCHKAELYAFSQKEASGKLYLDRGTVSWFLSCDRKDIIEDLPNRSIKIDNYILNLDVGFTDLHTQVYKNLLNGEGYGIQECRPAIELVHGMKESFNHI